MGRRSSFIKELEDSGANITFWMTAREPKEDSVMNIINDFIDELKIVHRFLVDIEREDVITDFDDSIIGEAYLEACHLEGNGYLAQRPTHFEVWLKLRDAIERYLNDGYTIDREWIDAVGLRK